MDFDGECDRLSSLSDSDAFEKFEWNRQNLANQNFVIFNDAFTMAKRAPSF